MFSENRLAMSVAQHVKDVVNLTATKLKEKYPETYTSWRNMKQRAKREGTRVHPDFEGFDSFLLHMGPRPSLKHTVDRRDFGDPEYSPEKCHWLDKAGQANNRSTTLWLTVRGQAKSLMDWAISTNQKPDTLRSRVKKGWQHEEVVFGKRKATARSGGQPQRITQRYFPWMSDRRSAAWERGYQRRTDGLAPRPTRYEYYFRRAWAEYDQCAADIDRYQDVLRSPELTDPLLPSPDAEGIHSKIEALQESMDMILEDMEKARAHLPPQK